MDAGATASSVKNSSTAASDPLARNFGDPVRSAPARRARSRAIRIVSSMLFKSRACTTSSAPCPSAVRSRSTAFARYWAETGSTSFQFRARARTKSESRQATRSARSSALSTARRTATQPASGHGFRNVLAPHSTRHPSRPRTPLQPDRRSPGSFSDEAVLHRARKLTDRHPGPRRAGRCQMERVANISLPRQAALQFRGCQRCLQRQPVGQKFYRQDIPLVADH